MKKTKSCKLMCMLLVLAMLLGLFAGCAAGGGEATTPPATTEPTQSGGPDVTEPSGGEDTTKPTGTEPADPGVTEPTVTDPSDATEPTDVTGPADVTEPTPPVVTEPGHEHEYSKTVTKATCTEDGFTTYSCECGDSYVGEATPATGHKFGEWVTTTEPTEAAEGAAERTCSTCGTKDTKVLDKLIPNHTHSYTEKVTKKATCSTEGVKTYTCSCGSSYTENISKTEHKYSKKETWPTCYSTGYMTYTCRNCGYSYKGDYKDKVDHSYSWEDVDPTCEEQGYNLYMCDYCLISYRADFIPATGHKYVDTVVAPTCSEKGYTLHKCSECDKSYKDSYTDAVDHVYEVTHIEAPGMTAEGYTTYTCKFCGNSYKSDFTPIIPQEEFERMVADATVKYINQFRQAQGDTAATSLPGLTNVAQYRAVQLQTNFAHDTNDLREALAYYQYGMWIDMTEYGCDPSQNHYYIGEKEAIIDGGGGVADAEELGYRFAEVLYYSSGHWSYVGSSKYPYIGVGATWSLNGWCICVLQTQKNYG